MLGAKNNGINKQGFVAGGARIAFLPNATAEQIDGVFRSNIKAGTTIISDGFKSYTNLGRVQALPDCAGCGDERWRQYADCASAVQQRKAVVEWRV